MSEKVEKAVHGSKTGVLFPTSLPTPRRSLHLFFVSESPPVLTGSFARTFRAVVLTVAPDADALDEEEWDGALGIVEEALVHRSPVLRRRLRLFLRLVEWLPLLRWLRPFTSLGPERRARWLRFLQDAPILPVRQGLWGVRTLAFMGYYGLPGVRRRIGYRAHPRGWRAEEARRGRADPAAVEPGLETQL